MSGPDILLTKMKSLSDHCQIYPDPSKYPSGGQFVITVRERDNLRDVSGGGQDTGQPHLGTSHLYLSSSPPGGDTLLPPPSSSLSLPGLQAGSVQPWA